MRKQKPSPMFVPSVIIGGAVFLIIAVVGMAVLLRSGKLPAPGAVPIPGGVPGLKSEMLTRIEHDPWWLAGISEAKIEKLLREVTEHSSCIIIFNQRGDYRVVNNFNDDLDDAKYHQPAPVIFWATTAARNPTLDQELPDDWRRVIVNAGYGQRLNRYTAEVLLDEAMKEPSKRQTRKIYEKGMDDFMGQLNDMANQPVQPQPKRR